MQKQNISSIMKKQTLAIDFTIFDYSELNPEEQDLIQQAKQSLLHSYSPYSHFKVGAAVLTQSKKVVIGSNQENIAYPSGLCAERTALFSACAMGEKPVAIAIVAQNEQGNQATAYPCGSCRQVLSEIENNISKQDIKVLILREDNSVICFNNAKDLLPFSFNF